MTDCLFFKPVCNNSDCDYNECGVCDAISFINPRPKSDCTRCYYHIQDENGEYYCSELQGDDEAVEEKGSEEDD